MAINIFQGSKPSKSSRVNTAANSTRAQAAKAALVGPSATSDSGSVAVGKTNTLSKIGNFVGKAAGIASKFLPGIGGTIAKGISNIFNDPEWWQSVPGDAVTLNSPLREVVVDGNVGGYQTKLRYTIGELCTLGPSSYPIGTGNRVMRITPTQANQYLLPEIRKVINAVPLQDATEYASVLENNATIYALWQQLKKFKYLLEHGQTYVANLDDPAFPLLRVENAAYLQSTIGRLEEYLRANVRLPHTLCEYLAWRFGRVYKSNSSAKSGLIMYDYIPVSYALPAIGATISTLLDFSTSTAAKQQANADLYNAYYDHDQAVIIADETQYKFDVKEFCLRTNLDVRSTVPQSDAEILDCVYIDSAMDNPTTFMASTVSTVGLDAAGAVSWLFPVEEIKGYIPLPTHVVGSGGNTWYYVWSHPGSETPTAKPSIEKAIANSKWAVTYIGTIDPSGGTYDPNKLQLAIGMAVACKALDIYNKDIYVRLFPNTWSYTDTNLQTDLTVLSMDMGAVSNTVLGNEHIYAFANLVHAGRKHSMSYKEAETLVSRDTANLVEKLDVAVAK